MKHFFLFLISTAFLFNAAPQSANAIDGVPTSVVRSYLMLKNGQSIRYEEDWEQIISFLNEEKLQALLSDEDLDFFLSPTTLRLMPPSVRLTLLQWQYQRNLFNFDWLATESTLLAISSYAETNGNSEFQKWASSRIALLYWLQGNTDYAKAYSIITKDYAGSEEVWFTLFEKAIAGESTPYSWFNGLLATEKLEEGLDFVVLPSGEWMSVAALMQQRIASADNSNQGASAFNAVNTVLPQAEMENLAPYLVQLSEKYNWDLGSIIIPNNAALQASRNWVHRFKVKQTEWQIIESEQKSKLAQSTTSSFEWPFSIPASVALGFGVLLVVFLTIRRNKKDRSTDNEDKVVAAPTAESSPAPNRSREKFKPSAAANKIAEDKDDATIAVSKPTDSSSESEQSPNAKTILTPTTSIVEAHQKSKQQQQSSTRYQASPKLVADAVLNASSEKKNATDTAQSAKAEEKKIYDSKNSQKSIVELTSSKPKVDEDDLDALSSRFIETLDEAKERADFDQLWEMVDRFIDKEYPNWKKLIEIGNYQFSDREFKYLSMMRIGIDNDRIAAYAGIQKASLRGARSRIRKKIGIEGDAEPHTWIVEKAKK